MTLAERFRKAAAAMIHAKQLRSEALAQEKKVNIATEKAVAQLIELLKPARAEAEAASEAASAEYFEAEAEYVKANDALRKKND